MKITLDLDKELADTIEFYADEKGISQEEAASRLMRSGAKRLMALRRYNRKARES